MTKSPADILIYYMLWMIIRGLMFRSEQKHITHHYNSLNYIDFLTEYANISLWKNKFRHKPSPLQSILNALGEVSSCTSKPWIARTRWPWWPDGVHAGNSGIWGESREAFIWTSAYIPLLKESVTKRRPFWGLQKKTCIRAFRVNSGWSLPFTRRAGTPLSFHPRRRSSAGCGFINQAPVESSAIGLKLNTEENWYAQPSAAGATTKSK